MIAVLFLLSAAFAFVFDKWLIGYFRQRAMHQAIREDGPKSHLLKGKTPSMGGLVFGLSLALFSLVFVKTSGDFWVVLVALTGCVLGGVDDWLKVSGKNKHGLKARTKILVLSLVAMVFSLHLLQSGNDLQKLPFGLGEWKMGLWVIPFTMIAINATANAVNLTDGLDGLLGGLMLISLATLFMMDGFTAARGPMAWMLAIVGGAIAGFMLLNLHPAKIFMGDAGSLFLGSFLCAWMLKSGQGWLIPVLGLVYVAEALSVIIQVYSFKTTGKRVFKMSPLHHHFELSGWHETLVVRRFWMAALGIGGVVMLWA